MNTQNRLRLSQDQIDQFRRDGVLVVENAVSPDQLAALRSQFDAWVEESKDTR